MGSIYSNQDGDGNPEYFKEAFRRELEALFPYLLNTVDLRNISMTTITLTKGQMHTSEYDFYKVCSAVAKLPRCYWWIMLRLNEMEHPNQFTGEKLLETVLVPSPTYFDTLLTQYLTTRPIVV